MKAFHKVQSCSSFPQTEYDGKLIITLFAIVEKAEKKFHPTDDDIILELESRVGHHLTIDEILDGANRRAS
jgi:hypothetical protein